MKSLTIEQLRALEIGGWVYVKYPDGKEEYAQKGEYPFDSDVFVSAAYLVCRYSTYGTKWQAWKNKEQAEAKDIDISLKCCENCRNKGFGEDKCSKLNKLFSDNNLGYEEDTYFSSSGIDRWSKRDELMKQFCCDDFDSRWLSYPIAVTEVECFQPEYNKRFLGHNTGELVKIRPCGKEYENKTYLGFYLGDLPISICKSYNRTTHILNIDAHNNPAIFVPQLGKIIFGCESWWGTIKDEKDFEDISDDCINNQWYVKALKGLYGNVSNSTEEE